MFMCKKNPVLCLQSLKKTTNGRKTLCFPTIYVKWREFNKNKNKQLRSNPWSMMVKRQEAEAHLLIIAHGLPPRPGRPLPGLQDPLDQQRVLGECLVNVSNSCREIVGLPHTPWAHCSKACPGCSLKTGCCKRAKDAGWDTTCPGIGRSPLAPAVLLTSMGNWELTARCTGLGDSH